MPIDVGGHIRFSKIDVRPSKLDTPCPKLDVRIGQMLCRWGGVVRRLVGRNCGGCLSVKWVVFCIEKNVGVMLGIVGGKC